MGKSVILNALPCCYAMTTASVSLQVLENSTKQGT